MTDSHYKTIAVDQHEGIVRITLNRPDRRNAMSRLMQSEIITEIERASRDAGAGVVIVKGAGKSFCSGYDIAPSDPLQGDSLQTANASSIPRRALATAEMSRGWARLRDAPIATIAQIHGHCLSGGTDLALSCDLILAADDTTIGFPALRMGGTPPVNMWLYNLGPQWAKRLLFTGDTFTGRLAAKIGFALEAVPASELEERVAWLARRIVAMGRDIVGINKHVLNCGLDLMGRTTLQQVAAPLDSIANHSEEMLNFMARSQEIGFSAAFKERDAPFADGVPIDLPATAK